MPDSSFCRPRSKTDDRVLFANRDGQVLMPHDLPICLTRFVKENSSNGKTFGPRIFSMISRTEQEVARARIDGSDRIFLSGPRVSGKSARRRSTVSRSMQFESIAKPSRSKSDFKFSGGFNVLTVPILPGFKWIWSGCG